MPRPHQAGGTRRHHRQIKPHLGDPLVEKKGRSTTRPRRAQTPLPVVKENLFPLSTPCNKVPVVGAAESSFAQTLQDPNVWLPNTIPDSPWTVPHKTIGSSSSTFTSTCQELVKGAADSTYVPALQVSDAPSLDEFVDSSSGQKLVEGVVSSLEKLLDTTSCEESNIANPWTETQNNIAVSSIRSRSEKFVAGPADSTTSVLTLQEPDVSSSDEYLDSSSEESITASPRTLPPTLGPNILVYRPANSFEMFYIRIDRSGSFWIYPNVGGPFQSIDETENAIDSFLDLWQCGTRISTTKGGPNSLSSENTCGDKWHLAQAILDQFNEQNNLSGNLAHELEDLLRKQKLYENHRWYFHFNFTTKLNDQSTGKKLFFAEVSHMQGKSDWEVNCCRMVEFEAKGGQCLGCKNNGSPDMQHPVETDAYSGGHLDGYLPFGAYYVEEELEDEDENDDEDEDEDEDEYEDVDEMQEEIELYGRRVTFKPGAWHEWQLLQQKWQIMDARKYSKSLPAS